MAFMVWALGVMRLPRSLSSVTCLKSIWLGGSPTERSMVLCSSSPQASTSRESAFHLYPAFCGCFVDVVYHVYGFDFGFGE